MNLMVISVRESRIVYAKMISREEESRSITVHVLVGQKIMGIRLVNATENVFDCFICISRKYQAVESVKIIDILVGSS